MKSFKNLDTTTPPLAPAWVGRPAWRKMGLVAAVAAGVITGAWAPSANAVDPTPTPAPYVSSAASEMLGVELATAGVWNSATYPTVADFLANPGVAVAKVTAALKQAVAQNTNDAACHPELYVTYILTHLPPKVAVDNAASIVTNAIDGLKGSANAGTVFNDENILLILNAATKFISDTQMATKPGEVVLAAKIKPVLVPAYKALLITSSSNAASVAATKVLSLLGGTYTARETVTPISSLTLGMSGTTATAVNNVISVVASLSTLPTASTPDQAAVAGVVGNFLANTLTSSTTAAVGTFDAIEMLKAVPAATLSQTADVLLGRVAAEDKITYIRNILSGRKQGTDGLWPASYITGKADEPSVIALTKSLASSLGADVVLGQLVSGSTGLLAPLTRVTGTSNQVTRLVSGTLTIISSGTAITAQVQTDAIRTAVAVGVAAAQPAKASDVLTAVNLVLTTKQTAASSLAVATKIIGVIAGADNAGVNVGAVISNYITARAPALGNPQNLYLTTTTRETLATSLIGAASLAAKSNANNALAIEAIAKNTQFKSLVTPGVARAAVLATKLASDPLGLVAFSKGVASDTDWTGASASVVDFTKSLSQTATNMTNRAYIAAGAAQALNAKIGVGYTADAYAADLGLIAANTAIQYKASETVSSSTATEKATAAGVLVSKLGSSALATVINAIKPRVVGILEGGAKRDALAAFAKSVAGNSDATKALTADITSSVASGLSVADRAKIASSTMTIAPANAAMVKSIVASAFPAASEFTSGTTLDARAYALASGTYAVSVASVAATRPAVADQIGLLIKSNNIDATAFLTGTISGTVLRANAAGPGLVGGMVRAYLTNEKVWDTANYADSIWGSFITAGTTAGNSASIAAEVNNAINLSTKATAVINKVCDALIVINTPVATHIAPLGLAATTLGPIGAAVAGTQPSVTADITATLAAKILSLTGTLSKVVNQTREADTTKVTTAVKDLGTLAGSIASNLTDSARIREAIVGTTATAYGMLDPILQFYGGTIAGVFGNTNTVAYTTNATLKTATKTGLFFEQVILTLKSGQTINQLTDFAAAVVYGNAAGGAGIASGLAEYAKTHAMTLSALADNLSVATGGRNAANSADLLLTAAGKANMAAGLAMTGSSNVTAGVIAGKFALALNTKSDTLNATDRTLLATTMVKAVSGYSADIAKAISAQFSAGDTAGRIVLVKGLVGALGPIFPKQTASERIALVVSSVVKAMDELNAGQSAIAEVVVAAIKARAVAAYDIVGSTLAAMGLSAADLDIFKGTLTAKILAANSNPDTGSDNYTGKPLQYEVLKAFADVLAGHTGNLFYWGHVNGQETCVTNG